MSFFGTPELDLLIRVFVRKPYHMMGRYGARFVARIWDEQIRMNVRTFTTFSDSAHARLSLEVEGNMYTIVHILDLPSIEEIIPCFYRMILCSGPLQSHTLMYSHYAHLCTVMR